MSEDLVLENVTSGYGAVTVVREVSMRVAAREIVAILGSNGAGKSTLLQTVVGLLSARAGRITLGSRDVTSRSTEWIARHAGVVLVPQGRQLFPSMSVADNLMLGAFGHRRDRAGTKTQLQTSFELFPILRERRGQQAGNLSGGQQQMLAIARGLMARPKVLLLDEPSLGLAPLVLDQVFEALKKLRELGVTILIVEQNAMMTLELADRAYVLERGRITAEGPADAMTTDPRIREAYLGLKVTAAAG